jgi:hypothetical protein
MFSNEIFYQIFEEVLLLCDKSTNDNIFLTSRCVNEIFSRLIKNKFESRFGKVNVKKSIYRSIVDASIIKTMRLDDDEEMSAKEFESARELREIEEFKKIKSNFELRRTELISFAKEICVQHKFIILLIFLDHGKKLYRNMMVKRYVMH